MATVMPGASGRDRVASCLQDHRAPFGTRPALSPLLADQRTREGPQPSRSYPAYKTAEAGR